MSWIYKNIYHRLQKLTLITGRDWGNYTRGYILKAILFFKICSLFKCIARGNTIHSNILSFWLITKSNDYILPNALCARWVKISKICLVHKQNKTSYNWFVLLWFISISSLQTMDFTCTVCCVMMFDKINFHNYSL